MRYPEEALIIIIHINFDSLLNFIAFNVLQWSYFFLSEIGFLIKFFPFVVPRPLHENHWNLFEAQLFEN
jgi:hypothetical protein